MNYQVDIIIIGDSKNGHYVLDKIAAQKPSVKLAYVSREFKSTTTHDYLNVEYFKEEVVLVDYKNRLFGCYLKNGTRIYGTHLVIASGLRYDPLILNNKPVLGVHNNIDDAPKTAKMQPAVVLGNKNSDVRFALNVAKKYKQVYLCIKDSKICDLTKATAEKLENTENIVLLPNTALRKAIYTDGVLTQIELDNFSTLNCSAIYTKTDAHPEVDFIPNALIQKSSLGYLITDSKAESTLVPKCFAVGNCVQRGNDLMKHKVIETILSDF